ncbi:MAG TPA: RNA methyltransferase, partial [Planctomycetaceae bacterium]|nr:RNA methyltransferase [Planctomycetaceae bacterium]
MPLIALASLDDPRLDVYRHLKATNLTRWSDLFVAEGARVARRLLSSDYELEHALVSEERLAEMLPHLRDDRPTYLLPHALAKALVGYNFHTGVLACGRRRPGPDLASIVNAAGPKLVLVVCPAVNDPDNLGSIIRTGAAFGVDAVVLGRECADPFSRRVLRVSMGSALRLPIVETRHLERELVRLRDERHVDLVATVLDEAAEPLASAGRSGRTALVFGNEAHGLGPEWTSLCTRRVTIPMQRGADSLNVAVAAAIFLHHFQTRADNADGPAADVRPRSETRSLTR